MSQECCHLGGGFMIIGVKMYYLYGSTTSRFITMSIKPLKLVPLSLNY